MTMHISTYSDDKAQVDINKLIHMNNGEVQYNSRRIGCCRRYYLIFKHDNHKYYYNPNKLISDTLRKKLFNHLYTMSPKRLNKKTKQPDIIINDIVAPDDNDDYFNLQQNISKPARDLKRKILTTKLQQFIKKRINKKTKQSDIDARNNYVSSFIDNLKQLRVNDIKEVAVNLKYLNLKEIIKLIKTNIPDKKLALRLDGSKDYVLSDHNINKFN
jgi:hypothetical protein